MLGLRPRLKGRRSLVDLLVRGGGGGGGAGGAVAGGQSDPPPPPPFGGSDASSSPLSLNSVGTAPACDRQLHADLDQASNLPLPPSPDTPPLDESASAPTDAPDSIPKIVVDLAAPIPAPSNPAPAAAAAASSPSMAPVSHPSSLTACACMRSISSFDACLVAAITASHTANSRPWL
jgi:hypothetical protein